MEEAAIPEEVAKRSHAARSQEVIDSRASAARGEKLSDAASQVVDSLGGYSLRFVAGPRECLVWQAGNIVTERRSYRAPGMMDGFHGSVTIFHLLGHGASREDAVAMAKLRNGKTG